MKRKSWPVLFFFSTVRTSFFIFQLFWVFFSDFRCSLSFVLSTLHFFLFPTKRLLEVKHEVDLLDVEVRPSVAEGDPPRCGLPTPPSAAEPAAAAAASANSQLRPRSGEPRAAAHLEPQALGHPEPVPEREGVARPHGAAASQLVPEGQRRPQRLCRKRRRARARGPSAERIGGRGVPAAAQGEQPVIAHPGKDPYVSSRRARAPSSQQRRQREPLVVAERPRRRVDPQRPAQNRIFDRTPHLDVPGGSDVVRLELELQGEQVERLDEADAVREAGGVGDAAFFFFFFFRTSFEGEGTTSVLKRLSSFSFSFYLLSSFLVKKNCTALLLLTRGPGGR